MNEKLWRIHGMPIHCSTILALLLLCGAAGCADNQPEMGMVRGIVTLNGTPLTGGWVHSHPELGRGAAGSIQRDGTFELSTTDFGKGAVVGKHVLTVMAYEEVPDGVDPDIDEKSLVPQKYTQPGSSGLSVEVVGGEEKHVSLDLKK